jgi:cobalt-zinc-cadmium efflux system membrane fusion protein
MAAAALQSACEQTAFDSKRQRVAAEVAAQDARRRLEIARQHLVTLLGYDEPVVEATGGHTADRAPVTGASLSLVESRAPFGGTIESKRFGISERVKIGDTLLVLADTTRLWVVADLREKDWQALGMQPDQELQLEFPALPDHHLAARLYYLGREVASGKNAIPLVAFVDNPDGLLRPGLFVRVSVPLGEPREALAVPSSAVVEHEGQKFVFVAEESNEFRRADVRTGETAGPWTEIVAGLAEQTPIVVEGAFFLKSELLLEREE